MPKINFKKIKLLVVDMDNTLCDTYHTLSKHQWEHAAKTLERQGYVSSAKRIRESLGHRSFVKTLEHLRIPQEERLLAVKAYDHVNIATLKLYPDAHHIFSLKTKKVLVTRGERKLQTKKVRHLKLAKKFDKVYFVTTFGDKADTFRHILKQWKLAPDETLVIGDRVDEEISDANRLDMPSILVRRPDWPVRKDSAKPTMTVRSLATIAKRLK